LDVIRGDRTDGNRGGVQAGAAYPALRMMQPGDGGEEIIGEIGAGGVARGVAGGGKLLAQGLDGWGIGSK
jgi:hypothetical protein